MPEQTDVVIAGGSVAGCALAALLGRQGVNVTVLEKSPKPEHYKVVCSHFIQAGATPVLQRLGIDATMERAGALRNGLDVWTAAGGTRCPTTTTATTCGARSSTRCCASWPPGPRT